MHCIIMLKPMIVSDTNRHPFPNVILLFFMSIVFRKIGFFIFKYKSFLFLKLIYQCSNFISFNYIFTVQSQTQKHIKTFSKTNIMNKFIFGNIFSTTLLLLTTCKKHFKKLIFHFRNIFLF